MMHRLIIVSTTGEIRPYLDENEMLEKINEQGWIQVDSQTTLGLSGVGIPATLVRLHQMFTEFKPKSLFQIGFAGSYKPQFPMGSLVEVQRDCFADLGIDNQGVFMPLHRAFPDFEGAYGWMEVEPSSGLPCVKAATVNCGTGSLERIKMMQETWDPDIETMEGAAALLFARLQQIPFSQIRVISNRVEPRDPSAWDPKLASVNLSEWLQEFLNS